jgi:hypothetical protein
VLSLASIFSFNCHTILFITFNSAIAESPRVRSIAIARALLCEKQILSVTV